MCEKSSSKTSSKKVPCQSQTGHLFQCQEAPGEAASRAHRTDKKQLFEQQLKHCSRFLQKKVDWVQNWCEKLIGLLTCCKKLNGFVEIVLSFAPSAAAVGHYDRERTMWKRNTARHSVNVKCSAMQFDFGSPFSPPFFWYCATELPTRNM